MRSGHSWTSSLDFSKLELIFNRRLVGKDGRPLYARWKGLLCTTRLYVSAWEECFKTPEWCAWAINHESIHGLVNMILDEKSLDASDSHWPFRFGLDTMFGICFNDTHPPETSPDTT